MYYLIFNAQSHGLPYLQTKKLSPQAIPPNQIKCEKCIPEFKADERRQDHVIVQTPAASTIMTEGVAIKSIDYSLYLVTGRDLLPPGKVSFSTTFLDSHKCSI